MHPNNGKTHAYMYICIYTHVLMYTCKGMAACGFRVEPCVSPTQHSSDFCRLVHGSVCYIQAQGFIPTPDAHHFKTSVPVAQLRAVRWYGLRLALPYYFLLYPQYMPLFTVVSIFFSSMTNPQLLIFNEAADGSDSVEATGRQQPF